MELFFGLCLGIIVLIAISTNKDLLLDKVDKDEIEFQRKKLELMKGKFK